MTATEAKALGWKLKGNNSNYSAEKGRVLLIGPKLFVLKLVEKSEQLG